MLPIDAIDSAQLASLIRLRADMCASIYIETTPLSQEAAHDPVKVRNAVREAVHQLEAAGADKRRVAALVEHVEDIAADEEFWRHQARSLAILATPDSVRAFRLATRVTPLVAVSDRYHLGPLFRAASVGQHAYVLALTEEAARLIAVSPDQPAVELSVPGMPKDAASAVRRASVNDRSPSGRIHGSEGQKVLLKQYARKVDAAVSAALRGQAAPLILAAGAILASTYRSVNSHPALVAMGIDQTPDKMTSAQLADAARPILDAVHRERLEAWRKTYDAREPSGRATTDMQRIARAATFGAVDSMLIDIDRVIEGKVDDETGAVTLASQADAVNYDVIDEIAGRVILSGGTVYGVRKDDLPSGEPMAAVLRFAV